MKLAKNKIVFASLLLAIVLFIISYTLLMYGEGNDDHQMVRPNIPELDTEGVQYHRKLDAVNKIEDPRKQIIPPLYKPQDTENNDLVDTVYSEDMAGQYDPPITAMDGESDFNKDYIVEEQARNLESVQEEAENQKMLMKELGLEHQLFFASDPIPGNTLPDSSSVNAVAVVDGNQMVKNNSRLRMRLSETIRIKDSMIRKNTAFYGFIQFRPNRVLIKIDHIDHLPVELEVYDFQDGSPGIYIENNYREEIRNEVFDDMLDEINIPSVPQVNGITKIFKRNNQHITANILNNYKLILKDRS